MLIDMGLAGRRIAVMGQGCYEWIVSYLAVVCGAGIVVPVDKDLSAAEIENLMKTAECDTIFCTRGECEKLKRSDVIRNLIVMEFYGDRTSAEELPQAVPVPLKKKRWPEIPKYTAGGALAEGRKASQGGQQQLHVERGGSEALTVILFTSGTTGNPKGVMLNHRNITSNIMDVCRIAHILESDKTLSILPIHHTYECTLGMLLVLYRGSEHGILRGSEVHCAEYEGSAEHRVHRSASDARDDLFPYLETGGKAGQR